MTAGERGSARVRDCLQTAFRAVPWPTDAGLRSVGKPDENSPVLVTCNYDLTVRRLVRALRGVDAWIVVAPSRGINVWCAAAGGHFTTHQVVTALKTSGVAEKVKHRNAILPQLSATGVEGLEVFRRSRWRVRFGPVRAEDIPAYLAADGEKSDAMRRVTFTLGERLEMAAMWGAPTALLLGAAFALLHTAWALPLMALCAALSVAVFLVYDRLPEPRKLWVGSFAVIAALASVVLAGGGAAAIGAAVVAPLVLTAIVTFDYTGSTPLEGGSHFDNLDWKLTFDPERCIGVYRCWEVCPEACFEKRQDRRQVDLAHDERCVRCGACVVQCPKDALAFEDGHGHRIEPDTVRRFKLNLAGRRAVAIPGSELD